MDTARTTNPPLGATLAAQTNNVAPPIGTDLKNAVTRPHQLSESAVMLTAFQQWAQERKPLLVIVDEQYPNQVNHQVQVYQKEMLQAAGEHQIPTLFLNNRPESALEDLVCLTTDAPQILKTYHNGFQTKDPLNAIFAMTSFHGGNQTSPLEQYLKDTDRDLLILAGFDGLICVAHTAGITYAQRKTDMPHETDNDRLKLGITKGAVQLGYDVAIAPAGLNTQSTRDRLTELFHTIESLELPAESGKLAVYWQ